MSFNESSFLGPNISLSKSSNMLFTFAPITPSSAAVFKLWFYGTLLRSKTIKPRLKNCPAQARSAGAVLQRLVIAFFLRTKYKSCCIKKVVKE
jgi:hypothetical protein